MTPALRRRRILVHGNGVAGLELAWVAAQRGHQVTVATGDLALRRPARAARGCPGPAEVADGVAYFRGALERLGVTVVERVRPGDHDVTVDATPGRPFLAELAGPDGRDVVLAEDVLASRVNLAGHGDRVAVLGSGIFAGEAALFLAAAGMEITLLASVQRAMADAHPLVADTTAHRFARHGGTTITGVTLRGAADGHLKVTVDGEPRRLRPFDLLVSGLGWTAQPTSPTAVDDSWDAFVQRLLVAHAARMARLV